MKSHEVIDNGKLHRCMQRIFNPFIWIAGEKALMWGAVGMVISVLLAVCSGAHANGLLTYGPGIVHVWYVYLGEYLIIWLLPALFFYITGCMLSRSSVRLIDVSGTVLFAQLPLAAANVVYLLPPVQVLFSINLAALSPDELMELFANRQLMQGIYLVLLATPFIILTIVWMVNALKVSCNLKQWKWYISAFVCIVASDIISRLLIARWQEFLA